jgi:hypothetical protein
MTGNGNPLAKPSPATEARVAAHDMARRGQRIRVVS